MHLNQWTLVSMLLLAAFIAMLFIQVDGHRGGGGGGHHGGGHHGGGGYGHHGQGGSQDLTQCSGAQQFFTQWWPQSPLGSAFQTVCRQLGVAAAWTNLQNLLGVPATGAADQTTFQALLNNANPALLAQQLLLQVGATGK